MEFNHFSRYADGMLFDLSQFCHAALFAEKKPWEVIASLEAYFSQLPLGKIEGEVSEKATIVNREQVSIEKGAKVFPESYIEGPCFIGKDAVVGHSAYVRSHTILGERSVVGHASEVKHSIFLNGAKAPHFNYVGDSIIGNGANLGAGVICANLRFDQESVKVYFAGTVHNTGMRKLGAFVGDGTYIGCNCVTNPGAVFYPGSCERPNQNLLGERTSHDKKA